MLRDPWNYGVEDNFDRDALARICTMHETDFAGAYDLSTVKIPEREGQEDCDWYAFRDNGSSILAVAHLDTVISHKQRMCGFLETAAGEVCYSGSLDDRLGAYTILELLPKLGINVDILLTTGEESGRSTAEYFKSEKDYNWAIEFDRGGTDVVMYEYEDDLTVDLVRSVGARVGMGSFSDIAYLTQLGVKAFNWGVGYQDYHSTRGHVFLDDLFQMIEYFVDFHDLYSGERLEHEAAPPRRSWWGDDDDDVVISPRTSMFGTPKYGGFAWAKRDDEADPWEQKA